MIDWKTNRTIDNQTKILIIRQTNTQAWQKYGQLGRQTDYTQKKKISSFSKGILKGKAVNVIDV